MKPRNASLVIGSTVPSSRDVAGDGYSGQAHSGRPWQKGYTERLIGLIRCECLDHVVVLGEACLRKIMRAYADYYNGIGAHRSLNKDAPISRPIQRIWLVAVRPVLGGLYHHYARI